MLLGHACMPASLRACWCLSVRCGQPHARAGGALATIASLRAGLCLAPPAGTRLGRWPSCPTRWPTFSSSAASTPARTCSPACTASAGCCRRVRVPAVGPAGGCARGVELLGGRAPVDGLNWAGPTGAGCSQPTGSSGWLPVPPARLPQEPRQRPVRLIVVDSIGYLFRDVGDRPGVAELAGRTELLFRISSMLRCAGSAC